MKGATICLLSMTLYQVLKALLLTEKDLVIKKQMVVNLYHIVKQQPLHAKKTGSF